MSFRPPFWASLLSLSAMLLFGMLASWQYQRGEDKADIIARRSAAPETAVDVNQAGHFPSHGRWVELRGRWIDDEVILLDNQTRKGKVGVHVLTPFQLDGLPHLVLVNRGWVATSPIRDELPETGELTDSVVQVKGIWRALPQAGMRSDDGQCDPGAAFWPQRLNYPSAELIQCLYQQPVAEGLVLLDPDAENGFVREWSDLGIPPAKHYGYALQWFAMLVTTLVLYVLLNLKRNTA